MESPHPRGSAASLLALLALLSLLALLTIGACSPPRDVSGLAGTYVMNQTPHADTLVLSADGRYVRWFKMLNGPAATDSGSWTLSPEGERIGLREFPKRWAFGHDLVGDTTQGRILEVPINITLTVTRRVWGTVRLGWYPEQGWWFVRIRS
ncbi:MAG: hypothetical protein O2973_03920 [Gemmatimonadetes bacterium]|nr:hypothetical protein [Gemmatimonadota bacterium]